MSSRPMEEVGAVLCQELDAPVLGSGWLGCSRKNRGPALLSILIIDHLLEVRQNSDRLHRFQVVLHREIG